MKEKIPSRNSVDLDGAICGAHGGGVPPGWDFAEAHEGAEHGIDLWMLDSTLQPKNGS